MVVPALMVPQLLAKCRRHRKGSISTANNELDVCFASVETGREFHVVMPYNSERVRPWPYLEEDKIGMRRAGWSERSAISRIV